MDVFAERAKKILLHEQRTNHQDAVVKPGGLAMFFQNWAANSQAQPHEFAQRMQTMFANYRKLDPMQRAAAVRAALTLLDDEKFPETAAVNFVKQPEIKQAAAGKQQVALKPVTKQVPEFTQHAVAPQNKSPDAEYVLRSPVTAIPGVGPSMADKLEKLGLFSAQDVLYYLPREHLDYATITPVSDLENGALATIMALVWEVENIRAPHSRVTRTIARVSDGTSSIRAVWFNQPFLNKLLKPGEQVILTGIKERYGSTVQFSVKTYEIADKNDTLNTGRIVPVYPLTEGVTAKQIRRITKFVVDKFAPLITEYLPDSITNPLKLPSIQWALANYHYPADQESLALARRRLGFDELFILEIGMIAQKGTWQQPERAPKLYCEPWRIFKDSPAPTDISAPAPALFSDGLWGGSAIGEQCFEKSLPFAFTAAQKRVINEILHDMDAATPMCRLLQGDVGSGKTAVAAAAMMACARNGMQAAIMAPTEILAEQHAKSLQKMFAPFGIEVFQLTGNMGMKQRNETLSAIESGAARIIAGTHALIQDSVSFAQLGLVIVDEQHRFGVEQRETLRKKGNERTPHLLVMTATPIPRTLALTVYGDLDVSVIDEMPLGRKPIITRWRAGSRREEAYQQMAIEVGQGRQGYIICPLIEESESLEAKAATAEYDRLRSDVFPHLRLGLAHGALKPSDKDSAMRKFRDGETDILVATSVVEVGVDVPNATMIIIEDADRFGLAQLHQFRGRVGRGENQSYCYLLSASAGAVARERLAVIERTTDGFKLAEEDLRMRGPGEFFGVRQSGAPELRVAQLTDVQLVEQARGAAEQLWRQDPSLDLPEHAALRNRAAVFWRQFTPQ